MTLDPVPGFPDLDPFGMVPAFSRLGAALAARPDRVAMRMASLAADSLSGQPGQPDPRFAGDAWRRSPSHEHLALQYGLLRKALLDLVRDAEGLDERTRRKAEFFAEQFLDALAPSNFLWTNPEALEEAWRTAGLSLVHGWNHFLADRTRGLALPSQTSRDAFAVGVDLAATPGKVVARNALAEVIQYSPLSDEVHAVPIVILPPWINKYYILDLQPEGSFVRHLLRAGFTVFVVSWKNPDASMSGVTFTDYLEHGVLFARDVAGQVTGVPDPIALGYCIGGILLSIGQAYLAGAGLQPFRSIGLITTMVDFEECGPIKVYIDERTIRHIERNMEERGYLSSDEMGGTFAMLRARDLVWTYWVENYLKGKSPPAFDLLFWNADSTRMPRAMHSWYLRKMYLENLLRVPGALEMKGVPIDLGRIEQDVYLVAAEKDHIAPYPAVYRLHRYVRGPIRFVLASSGHIAGIINPPNSG
jgi:polyhydroxyalkanoate synthase